MSKRTAVGLAGVVLVVASGWALAQPGPAAPKPAEQGGSRFAVVPVGTTAVLVDSGTGRTWTLHTSADGRPGAWLPTQRLDKPDEAAAWLATQDKLKAVAQPAIPVRRGLRVELTLQELEVLKQEISLCKDNKLGKDGFERLTGRAEAIERLVREVTP